MLRVLVDQEQIDRARSLLQECGCDTRRGFSRLRFTSLYAIRHLRLPPAVDVIKSWDVWSLRETILQHAPDRNALIYDLGTFNSETPLVLWRTGYRRLRGADLDRRAPEVRWYGYDIDARVEDFYNPDLAPGSVDVITGVSTIEHGYDEERLLATASGLLKPGGLLLLTTDYREEKLATPEDFRLFGLTWRIFSRPEIEDLIAAAARHGLAMLGDARWETSTNPIRFMGYQYTFAYLALRKGGAPA